MGRSIHSEAEAAIAAALAYYRSEAGAAISAETAAAGRGIGQAEREIGLLREYRTRLIADVVTGKLDVREAAPICPKRPARTIQPPRRAPHSTMLNSKRTTSNPRPRKPKRDR